MEKHHSCGHQHGRDSACGCGGEHNGDGCGDGEHCGCEHEKPVLVLDAQREVTLGGLVGALVDLGIVPFQEMMSAYKSLKLDVEPKFAVDIAKGCRGVSVHLDEGEAMTKESLFARLTNLEERFERAVEIVHNVYRIVDAVCSDEQNSAKPDLGSFLKTDVFGLLFLAAVMLAESGSEGLYTTALELGNKEYTVGSRSIAAPASLAAKMLVGTLVSVTAHERGIDVPSAALVASCIIGQTDNLKGILGACGFGLEGDCVTRIYLVKQYD